MARRITFYPLIALLLGIPAMTVDAQTPPGVPGGGVPSPRIPIFRFNGSSNISGEHANRQGTGQETPADLGRWEIDPVLSLYGIPFSTHLMLSTEQDITRQNINSMSLGFNLNSQQLQEQLRTRIVESLEELYQDEDLEEYRDLANMPNADMIMDSLKGAAPETYERLDRLRRLENLQDVASDEITSRSRELGDLGLVSGAEKFMYNFPTLGIGVNYPEYSPTSLSGVPVTGANLEFVPGKFYMALSGGKTQSEIVYTGDGQAVPAFERHLYAGRIGYGHKNGGHFYATILYAGDDPEPLISDSNSALTPKQNYVVGFEAKVPIVENYFSVEGELLGSMLTGDRTSASLDNADIPEFVVELVDPTISSFVDYTFSGRALVNIAESGTKLSGDIQRIGAGFYSLGAPNLRNDMFKYEVKGEQSLVERQVTIGGSYRQEYDNLVDWKSATTTITSYAAGLGLNFNGLPYLRLSYNPYIQTSEPADDSLLQTPEGDSQRVENRTGMISVMTGYTFNIGEVNTSTNVSFTRQETKSRFGDADNSADNYNISESVNFLFPLSLSLGLGLIDQKSTFGDSKITTVDLSGTYTLFDDWQNTLGVSLASTKDTDDKTGFYLSSSFPVWQFGTMEIRAEKNLYKYTAFPESGQDYDEFILRGTLSSMW